MQRSQLDKEKLSFARQLIHSYAQTIATEEAREALVYASMVLDAVMDNTRNTITLGGETQPK